MRNVSEVWKKYWLNLKESINVLVSGLKTIGLIDYNALAREIEASDEHSTIAESQSSNSYMEK